MVDAAGQPIVGDRWYRSMVSNAAELILNWRWFLVKQRSTCAWRWLTSIATLLQTAESSQVGFDEFPCWPFQWGDSSPSQLPDRGRTIYVHLQRLADIKVVPHTVVVVNPSQVSYQIMFGWGPTFYPQCNGFLPSCGTRNLSYFGAA